MGWEQRTGTARVHKWTVSPLTTRDRQKTASAGGEGSRAGCLGLPCLPGVRFPLPGDSGLWRSGDDVHGDRPSRRHQGLAPLYGLDHHWRDDRGSADSDFDDARKYTSDHKSHRDHRRRQMPTYRECVHDTAGAAPTTPAAASRRGRTDSLGSDPLVPKDLEFH